MKQWSICYFIVVACNLVFSCLHHKCPFGLCPSPWLTCWLQGIVNLVEGRGFVAWRVVASSLMSCVWLERIKMAFEGKERSVGQIKSGFLRMLFQWDLVLLSFGFSGPFVDFLNSELQFLFLFFFLFIGFTFLISPFLLRRLHLLTLNQSL